MPLTTRPSLTSRHGMRRRASVTRSILPRTAHARRARLARRRIACRRARDPRVRPFLERRMLDGYGLLDGESLVAERATNDDRSDTCVAEAHEILERTDTTASDHFASNGARQLGGGFDMRPDVQAIARDI